MDSTAAHEPADQTLTFHAVPAADRGQADDPAPIAALGATPEPGAPPWLVPAPVPAAPARSGETAPVVPEAGLPGAAGPPGPAGGDGSGPGASPLSGAFRGGGRVGDIPAVRGRRSWWRGQMANWRLYLVRMISAGLSVLLAVIVVPGLSFVAWSWGQGLEISVIFALINAFVKPVLQFLSLRFLFSSYGVVIVVINTVLLILLSRLMDDSIVSGGIVSLLLGGALIGIVGAALDAVLGADYPVLDRDYRQKVGPQ